MIRISRKADYAILAMGFLARRWLATLRAAPAGRGPDEAAAGDAGRAHPELAQSGLAHPAGLVHPAPGHTMPPVPAQEIADTNDLPKAVVANLLKDLARADLLESLRGIHGGYRLARHPDAISLADILETVDGPFQLVECATDGADSGSAPDHDCRLSDCCPSRDPMRILHDRIVSMMRATSLTELSGADHAAAGCSIPTFDPPTPADDDAPAGVDDSLATSSRTRQ